MSSRSGCCCILPLLMGFFSCGTSDGSSADLSIYNGRYAVQEAFKSDSGTQCPAPPTAINENVVQILITKSQIKADFTNRWGTLMGQIDNDTTFIISGTLGVTESLQCSGRFSDTTMTGLLRDIRAGCTREFDLSGQRTSP